MAIKSYNGKTTPKKFAEDMLWDAIQYIDTRDSGAVEGTQAYGDDAKMTPGERQKVQDQWDKLKARLVKKYPGTPNQNPEQE